MDLVPILIIGFIAGMASGAVVGGPATGYLASVVVGLAGALVGGWASTVLGLGSPADVVGVIVMATVGSTGIRLVLRVGQRPRSGGG